MGNIEHWLAANRERIWTMEHEGDYTDGDTIINVAINENGNVSVVIVPTDPTPGAVDDGERLQHVVDEAYVSLRAGHTAEALEYLRVAACLPPGGSRG